MPMETFVSCVGDLATLRRVRAGPDHRLFSPWTVFSFFVLSAILWRVESFTLAVPLRFGRFEFVSWGARSKTHEGTLAVWTIFGWSVSALPRFSGFLEFLFSSVRFTDRGLQATDYVNLVLGLATSPWFRLVSGFDSKFLGEQPPLFFCVSVYSFHFISF